MTITGIITAIVVGAIIGALARLILPGRQNIPIWLTIVVGIVAAVIGTFLARAVGISTAGPCNAHRRARPDRMIMPREVARGRARCYPGPR